MNTSLILQLPTVLLLLALPAALLWLWDRKLFRTFGIAVGRMAVQVGVLCLVVWLLYRYDRWWLRLVWCVLMGVGSAAVVLWRTGLSRRRLLLAVSGAQLAGCLLVGLWLYAVALRGVGPRGFVPLAALLFGHTAFSLIRGLGAYVSALRADRQRYEFLRGNGKSHLEAVMPFVRRAFQAVMAPSVANLAQTGLFAMPLLLGGLLLGGLSPLHAFLLMLLLVADCLAASVVSLILALWFADRRLFSRPTPE